MSFTPIDTNLWKLDVHATRNGKRRREIFRGTKPQAKRRHDELVRASMSLSPTPRTGHPLTVADVVALVVDDYRRNRRKSLKDAEELSARWRRDYGATRLPRLTHAALLTIADRWQATGLSPARVNRLMAHLLRGARLHQREDPTLVIPRWEKLNESPPRSGFLEWAEFWAMREAMEPYGRIPATIGFWCGMREGEILQLEWCQVRFNHVQKRVTLSLHADQTKTSEQRVIIMPGDLYKVLAPWHRETLLKFPDCPYVCHRQGKRLADTRYVWERAAVQVGLGRWANPRAKSPSQKGYSGILFHDLRRTGLRNLIRAGVPEKIAMAITGHKTRAVFDRYNIVNPRDLEQAGDRVAAYMAVAEEERLGRHPTGQQPVEGRRAT